MLLFPVILGLVIDHVPGPGSNDGWLGFWGTYVGSVLAFGGIYWQVLTSIKEERKISNASLEEQKKQNEIDRNEEKEISFSHSRPFFLPRQYCGDIGKFTGTLYADKCGGVKDHNLKNYVTILSINNVSNKPMFAVEIIATFLDGSEKTVKIARISDAEEKRIIFAKDDSNYCSNKIVDLKIFFTTEVREKILLVFRNDKSEGNTSLTYIASEKKLENKICELKNENPFKNYDTSDFVDAKKLKLDHGKFMMET
ncbi:hypothetical protein [Levilactobacillus brevis]|uniref:hypothetical protein n=1 Tax=Levilactobacillus brevis TaxID=1580 RepID=UPI0035147DA7